MLIKPFLSMNALGLIILLVLAGCDSRFKSEEVLSQYVADLDRSKYLSVISPDLTLPNSLPAKRFRQKDLSKFDIGILDFLSLQQCDIGHVVGQKNSVLGKVMTDSQRFLYELDIIRAIELCEINDLGLSRELQVIAAQKRRELPIAFANALFNGPEAEAFFSLSNGFLPLGYSTKNHQDLLASLNRFVEVGKHLDTLPQVDGSRFENDLKELLDSEYAGRLLYSLVRISSYLNQVSEALEVVSAEFEHSLICGAPMTYLRQQFKQHYVDVIQPYMGRIHSSAYAVLPLLNQLVELGRFSDEFREYLNVYLMDSESSAWGQYQLSSQRHAKAWSRLFKACAISLTANH